MWQNSRIFTSNLRSITSLVVNVQQFVHSTHSARNLSIQSAKVVRYHNHGQPEAVLKVETENLPQALSSNQVLVKLNAAPINPADINMIEGNYGDLPGTKKASLPAVGGNEGVGIVVEVGSQVTNLNVNERVIPARPGLGTWRSAGVFDAKDWRSIAEYKDIKDEYAATVSVNPSTAYRMLHDFEKLKEGDVIIQNGATSTVGLSVIQIAKAKGIKTINIIRNGPHYDEKVELLKTLGGYIVASEDYVKTAQFKRMLSELPKPKLALNCIGGDSVTEMARYLGNGGTLVTYGGMSRKPITVPTRLFIFNDIQLKGFWMTRWSQEHSEQEKKKMLDDLFGLIRSEKLKLWLETWDFDAFPHALDKYLSPQRSRKLLLKM